MTDKVPQFPGKPQQIGAQQKEPWAQSACPYSLSGAISRLGPVEEKLLVTAGAQNREDQKAIVPLPCIGPRCSLFMSTKLANGQEISGCALVMQVLETNRTNMLLARFLDAISEEEAPAAAPAAPATPTTP